MALDGFVTETMQALESALDEVPIGDARRHYGASCPEQVKQIFAAMNP